MKLIIDIADFVYDSVTFGETDYKEHICNAIRNGTPIPDNATNEGLLLVLYKDERLVNAIRQGTRDFLMYEPASDKWVSWLDAPYKADKEIEE